MALLAFLSRTAAFLLDVIMVALPIVGIAATFPCFGYNDELWLSIVFCAVLCLVYSPMFEGCLESIAFLIYAAIDLTLITVLCNCYPHLLQLNEYTIFATAIAFTTGTCLFITWQDYGNDISSIRGISMGSGCIIQALAIDFAELMLWYTHLGVTWVFVKFFPHLIELDTLAWISVYCGGFLVWSLWLKLEEEGSTIASVAHAARDVIGFSPFLLAIAATAAVMTASIPAYLAWLGERAWNMFMEAEFLPTSIPAVMILDLIRPLWCVQSMWKTKLGKAPELEGKILRLLETFRRLFEVKKQELALTKSLHAKSERESSVMQQKKDAEIADLKDIIVTMVVDRRRQVKDQVEEARQDSRVMQADHQ